METIDDMLARAEATIASVKESLEKTLEIIQDAKSCKSAKAKEVLAALVSKQISKYMTDPVSNK